MLGEDYTHYIQESCILFVNLGESYNCVPGKGVWLYTVIMHVPTTFSNSCSVANKSVRSVVRQAKAQRDTKQWRDTGTLWNLL